MKRLEVGEVIRRVFAIYVDQAPVLMPAAAVVFVFTGVLSRVLTNAGGGLALIALLISLVATTVFTGMVVGLVADLQDGRRDSSPGQLLRAVAPVIGQLIVVAFAAALGVMVGLFLVILPGLILLTAWSVAAPVVVLERPEGLRALRRSRELVRGNGWQVFGVILVLDLLVAIVAGGLDVAADSAGTGVGLVVTVVLGVLTAPFPALAAAVLYFELRARSAEAPREGGLSSAPEPTREAGAFSAPEPPGEAGVSSAPEPPDEAGASSAHEPPDAPEAPDAHEAREAPPPGFA
jgi:hypothetical protein